MGAAFLPVAEPDLTSLEERYVLDALRSGWVSSIGEYIERFEAGFAALCGVKHCVALSNGTVALHVALAARGLQPGDEVIVPDLTFVATAAAVVHAGATPVLVDVDPRTWCLDPELVERAVSPRTRAIIPVHLLGHPADMTALRTIADRASLFLLEDAAEAHGARWDGRTVGSIGDAACFSFFGNKLLTTGEGGCITTNDAGYAQHVRFLKDHAMSRERRYFHPAVGYNYRLTNLQAAIGCAQIERFPELLQKKANLLAWYREALDGSGIALNPQSKGAETVCWLVAALLPGEWSAERLDKVMGRLRGNGIDSRPFFVPLHELPPYRGLRFERGAEAVSSSLAVRGICLPSSSSLTRADVERVANQLRAALSNV
ncbi:DegT/DnrJ/EryC1/StrS family aminotransferase [Sorangium sp. So ce1000]|uniref:DegT/DnrJ/EryC1/StrS family aminotransferase n=1 Tax=Sorangium sp. So ce1000 TaxID=3133325 RepID=UPI003F5D5E1B